MGFLYQYIVIQSEYNTGLGADLSKAQALSVWEGEYLIREVQTIPKVRVTSKIVVLKI